MIAAKTSKYSNTMDRILLENLIIRSWTHLMFLKMILRRMNLIRMTRNKGKKKDLRQGVPVIDLHLGIKPKR